MTAGSYRIVYENARVGKKALAILTSWDHICKNDGLSTEERQIGFGEMIEIALEVKR